MDDVKIPWAKVVKAMGGETTVSATIQHLTKLRKRLGDKGHEVPPPHRVGNNRVDPGSGTSTSEKEGDSYDSDGEEAFKVEEDFGMARAKRAKREAKDDHGDRLEHPGFDGGRFARRRNPGLWEGDEGSMTSTLTLRNHFTKWIVETLLECRRHSEFEPSFAGEFNLPMYNTGQIEGCFDQASKYRASSDAACTSQNIVGFYPGLELDRVPSVPETIANSTGRNEDLLVDHGLSPADLNVDDSVGDPSFGNKTESQAMFTDASQELMGARSATHSITGTSEQQYQHSGARGQSLAEQGVTSSNIQWLADTFPEELDEWDVDDLADCATSYPYCT